MRGGSNIIGAIHSIKQAQDHFELFEFEHPGTVGANHFKKYRSKLEWIYKDIVTITMLTDEVRDGIRREWASDCFDVPAITEKVALLNPDQRSFIETIVDAMLKGEEVKVIEDPNQ